MLKNNVVKEIIKGNLSKGDKVLDVYTRKLETSRTIFTDVTIMFNVKGTQNIVQLGYQNYKLVSVKGDVYYHDLKKLEKIEISEEA